MEAVKAVVLGRTFFVDPCPECGQAEVRIREDGTAYSVCPCARAAQLRRISTMSGVRNSVGDSSHQRGYGLPAGRAVG
jgi:hypothetical protein